MSAAGIEHRVIASGYGEDAIADVGARELVALHAAAKARDVAARSGIPTEGGVIGADTAVVVDEHVLGKPQDRGEAERMLMMLAGRPHVVATGVCVITEAGEDSFVDEAVVAFRAANPALIAWYLDRGEWQGRAGGYAIQGSGATLVERVDGDVTTVIGLPIGRLLAVLEHRGLAPWSPAAFRSPG